MRPDDLIEHTFRLDNGTLITDDEERWDISSQLMHVKQYFKYGIQISKGDTIFDIGANIGLFGLVAYDMCMQDADVFCFEPIPNTFDELTKNLERVGSDRLKAFPFGISDISGEVNFTYYPYAPALSTIHSENMQIGLQQMIESLDQDVNQVPDLFVKGNRSPESLSMSEKDSRFNKMHSILALRTAFQEKTLTCEVKTLSDFISEEGVSTIHLLKIDVNGSELDIINGIKKEDLLKIKQIVIEVPLGGEKLETIRHILKEGGFTKVTIEEQDPVINKGLLYYIVYAVKDQL